MRVHGEQATAVSRLPWGCSHLPIIARLTPGRAT